MTKKELKRLAALRAKEAAKLTKAEKSELDALEVRAKAVAEEANLDETEQTRLAELRGKTADDLTDEEKEEITSLEAKGAGEEDDSEVITKEEFFKLAADGAAASLQKVMEANGLTRKQLDARITEIVEAVLGDDELTDENVEKAQKAITAGIQEWLDENTGKKTVKTKLTIKSASQLIINAVKGVHAPSKMRFNINTNQGRGLGFKRLSIADRQLVNVVMRKELNDGITDEEVSEAIEGGDFALAECQKRLASMEGHIAAKQYDAAQQDMLAMRRRQKDTLESGSSMESGASGFGADFVPTDLSSSVQLRLYLDSRLAAIMGAREILQPSPVFRLPVGTTLPTFYGTAEDADLSDSQAGTGTATLTVKKVAGAIPFTDEFVEDSVVAALPFIQMQMRKGIVRTYESMLINGDDSSTHMDSDTQAISGAPEKSWKGFRKLALNDAGLVISLSSGGVGDLANLRSMEKAAGIYSLDPGRVIWLAGPKGAHDMKAIPQVTTLMNFGGGATILTGVLPSIDGIEIVQSQFVRENLNASGVYDGVTTTNGSVLLVYPEGFLTGRVRDFTFEFYRYPLRQRNYLIASFRKSFTPVETPSSALIPTVVLGDSYVA